ncbi:hypothetical protein mRhiFer1_010280 [Rhinolophus ferrumequinum]|uniref:Uncharacterized protein n=1 Tax=Rhinolophus ferrumequinum TaxID=59479 RepID=A0A7J7X6H6_RHIFE|nr:hypothetical protein mRhiFer1_010280 [Rhinolophus ferrumequinum]
MDTFPWFCACRSDDLGAGSGEQGEKGMKSAEQRPIGGCYCCHQSKGFSAPEVPDPVGLKGRPFLLLRWPGLEVFVAAALRWEHLRVCGLFLWRPALELDHFPVPGVRPSLLLICNSLLTN